MGALRGHDYSYLHDYRHLRHVPHGHRGHKALVYLLLIRLKLKTYKFTAAHDSIPLTYREISTLFTQ